MSLGALLVPELHWDSAHGFEQQRRTIDDALRAGVGGFVVYGGARDSVRALVAELHERSAVPLLIAADAERGAGQQFEGCVALPPLAAFGFFENAAALRRAGQITARDLKRAGVNWALAPVCDLDANPGESQVGTRSAGADPGRVGALIAEWIDGCQSEGVMACAKNFPGRDLTPFHAAVDAGVASIMTVSASISERTLSTLRDKLEFDGLIVCQAEADPEAAVRAIAAGCDVLLAPAELDLPATVRVVASGGQRGTISADRARESLARRERWALWARPSNGREPSLEDEIWTRQVADASVHLVRGVMPRVGQSAEVVLVDDDASGAMPVPSRAHFAAALRELEIEANVLEIGSAGTRVPVLIAAFADVVPGKTTAGLSAASRERIERVIATSRGQKREALVVLFSHPRHAAQVSAAENVLCAWGGEPPMQAAAARVIARGAR